MGRGPACLTSSQSSPCHGGEPVLGGVRRVRAPRRTECKGRTIPSDTSSTMWSGALATVSMVVFVVAVLIEPCHSKSIKHHGQQNRDLFNFAQATAMAAHPTQTDIERELDAFKMMEPLDQMNDLVDLANDIGNDYKMLVYDLKHNRNEFAHSPHAANDLMALLEAMHHFGSDYAPIPKKQRLVRLT